MLKTEKQVIETLKLYYQVELYQNLVAPKQNKEQFCMDQTIQLMPEIATKIYYETSGLEQFPSSLIENAFRELKEKVFRLIEEPHMEEGNKKEHKISLDKLTLKLFQNDSAWKTFLEECCGNFYLTEDYLSNVLMFIENKRKTRNSLRTEDGRFIFTQFLDRQFSQVPEPIPNTNILVIPNIFLQKLKETQEYPGYIFESYLKFHLARALALHLKDSDEKLGLPFCRPFLNNLNNYLDNGDDFKYFKGQRLSYKPTKTLWLKVVQFSETTRMADNIALDLVFKDIYMPNKTFSTLPWISNDYSAQNLFFVLIAQEYCENPTMSALAQHLYETPNIPSTFRVDNMIMNSMEFSQIFKCPQGAFMNPEGKTQFHNYIDTYTSNEYGEPTNK